jgi:hypothetical protein
MTLKEKFENVLHNWIDEDYNRQHVAEELEIDADEFAIEFAEFMMNFDYYETKKLWIRNNIVSTDKFTTKELLQIYKKEKGL